MANDTDFPALEPDELHWFTGGRKGHENGTNAYIMTIVSRFPRQIVAFKADTSVNSRAIRRMVDGLPLAENYFTDAAHAYLGVDFFGRHRRNVRNKKDTYTVEGTNSDLRHQIPGLRRRSRCFFRKIETLRAVLGLFIDAYNKFGEAKRKRQIPVRHKSQSATGKYHKFRYPCFSVPDFL